MGGLSLGGPITGEAVLNAFVSGLRLAVLITCFGAANALAHPARLTRILPAALYEVGVAVVVAMTFVPQLAEALVRVRSAQRLRGRAISGLRGIRGIAVPVLEEALERAIALAASMDSRGYGRRAHLPGATRRLSGAGVLIGLGAAVVGTYQIISASGGHRVGLALLCAGTGLALVAGFVAGRRVQRTRYRPDPWRGAEWLVVGCGAVVAVTYLLTVHDQLTLGVPYAWPTLRLVPFLATLVAAVPAVATPDVPDRGAARPEAGARVIDFENVSVSYADSPRPVLDGVTVHVPEGELCLVVGSTGSGKSTLLGAVNGLVPHFTGGTLAGHVRVGGRDTRDHPPRELADLVGVVGQNPAATFVADTVEDELAWTMESLAVAPEVMRRRVEDVLDLLGLADLRARSVSSLSGGQAQRVAIGAVLTANPRVLVLDEPTSALDPAAAEDVLAAVHRLVHDLGLTVLMAEHRLERVVQHADTLLWLPGDGSRRARHPAADHAAHHEHAADRHAGPLARVGPAAADRPRRPLPRPRTARPAAGRPVAAPTAPLGAVVATAQGLTVRYGALTALRTVTLSVRAGEIVALMGRNGAGKSTLLNALCGLVAPSAGTVRLSGSDPRALRGRDADPACRCRAAAARRSALRGHRRRGVPHRRPRDRRRSRARRPRCCCDWPARWTPRCTRATCPRGSGCASRSPSCSPPVRRCCCSTSRPAAWTIPPRRGWSRRCASSPRQGHAVVLATHDVELAAEVSVRTVVLADGDVVADGPSREVVTQSPVFAPQIAKVLAPLPYLTVDDVLRSAPELVR